jgi:hypothetical protein
MTWLRYLIFPLIVLFILGISMWEADWFQRIFRPEQYWKGQIEETENIIQEAEEIKKEYQFLMALTAYDLLESKKHHSRNLKEFLMLEKYIDIYDSLIIDKQAYLDSIRNNVLIDSRY